LQPDIDKLDLVGKMRRPRTEAEMMEVAMDIEIGTGGMIVTVIETEVRGIGAAVKIVTGETGLIETGQKCDNCYGLGNYTVSIGVQCILVYT
jgi:hypothetical protein